MPIITPGEKGSPEGEQKGLQRMMDAEFARDMLLSGSTEEEVLTCLMVDFKYNRQDAIALRNAAIYAANEHKYGSID